MAALVLRLGGRKQSLIDWCREYKLEEHYHTIKRRLHLGWTLRKALTTPIKQQHGQSDSREYQAWVNMNQRCYNTKHPVYEHYGGRGIAVCPEWRANGQSLPYLTFRECMGECPDGHTLERVDNDDIYRPGNCIWATQQAQVCNSRRNVYITIDNVVLCVSQWARIYNISVKALRHRLAVGWEIMEALTTPVSRAANCRRGR